MRKCVHVVFRVNLHVCVTSTCCSHDQWQCWSIPQMGGAGLWKDCLIVCPAVSNTCRLSLLSMQMVHLWSPILTFLRGQRLQADCHVFYPKLLWTRDMLLHHNGIFPALPWPCWINALHKHCWRDTHHLWQLICQSLCFPLYLSNGEDVCIFCPPPHPPSLATIDFLCLWQARDLVGREETFSRNRAGPALHLPYLLLFNI